MTEEEDFRVYMIHFLFEFENNLKLFKNVLNRHLENLNGSWDEKEHENIYVLEDRLWDQLILNIKTVETVWNKLIEDGMEMPIDLADRIKICSDSVDALMKEHEEIIKLMEKGN